VPRTPPPPKLYKYQRFNEQTLCNLTAGQIRFTAPRDFNDPFDCALPMFDTSCLTDHDFRKAFAHYTEKYGSDPGVVARMCPAGVPSEAFKMLILRSVQDGFENRRRIMLEERGVACFSADPLNITMWSHYADGHRGFCLEFDTARDPFHNAYYVRYADQFPYVNPVNVIVDPHDGDPENELFVASALTKATCWQYEKEWRMVHMKPNHFYGYKRAALTGIYFGAQMSETHKCILSEMLLRTPTKLYQMHRDERGFTLGVTTATYTPLDYSDESMDGTA
jgi:Protein of unknown function (DUF2971)